MWKQRTCRPQQEIARALEISDAYLSQILHGVRLPSLKVMLRIESLTGIPLRSWVESPVNITPTTGERPKQGNITRQRRGKPRRNIEISA